ncbi:hypothetical protein BJ742DRAFT_428740 [Cladochytrium replicatum]|nr:hypothetical protein BJ742DRAFT_428740 [Cladochytrium replicatum]
MLRSLKRLSVENEEAFCWWRDYFGETTDAVSVRRFADAVTAYAHTHWDDESGADISRVCRRFKTTEDGAVKASLFRFVAKQKAGSTWIYQFLSTASLPSSPEQGDGHNLYHKGSVLSMGTMGSELSSLPEEDENDELEYDYDSESSAASEQRGSGNERWSYMTLNSPFIDTKSPSLNQLSLALYNSVEEIEIPIPVDGILDRSWTQGTGTVSPGEISPAVEPPSMNRMSSVPSSPVNLYRTSTTSSGMPVPVRGVSRPATVETQSGSVGSSINAIGYRDTVSSGTSGHRSSTGVIMHRVSVSESIDSTRSGENKDSVSGSTGRSNAVPIGMIRPGRNGTMDTQSSSLGSSPSGGGLQVGSLGSRGRSPAPVQSEDRQNSGSPYRNVSPAQNQTVFPRGSVSSPPNSPPVGPRASVYVHKEPVTPTNLEQHQKAIEELRQHNTDSLRFWEEGFGLDKDMVAVDRFAAACSAYIENQLGQYMVSFRKTNFGIELSRAAMRTGLFTLPDLWALVKRTNAISLEWMRQIDDRLFIDDHFDLLARSKGQFNHPPGDPITCIFNFEALHDQQIQMIVNASGPARKSFGLPLISSLALPSLPPLHIIPALFENLSRNPTFEKLSLGTPARPQHGNQPPVINAICALVKQSKSIKSLTLENINLDDSCMRSLASVLTTSKTLTSLNLSFNKIGDQGAIELVAALQHVRRAMKLVLAKNLIKKRGFEVFSNALKRGGDFGGRGGGMILQTLNLSGNPGWGEEVAEDLVESVIKNGKVKYLVLPKQPELQWMAMAALLKKIGAARNIVTIVFEK